MQTDAMVLGAMFWLSVRKERRRESIRSCSRIIDELSACKRRADDDELEREDIYRRHLWACLCLKRKS